MGRGIGGAGRGCGAQSHSVYEFPDKGTVAGISYGDEDVLRYSPTSNPQWAMHFDGSVAGLPAAADIDAYAYVYNPAIFSSWHYMSFDRPVNVPGLGKVDDSDVVLYHMTLLGSTWSLYLDGSQIGLTTDAEDIDAISLHTNGKMLFSTSGNYELLGAANTLYKGGDEDMLLWSSITNNVIVQIPGSGFQIAAGNDLHNLDFQMLGDTDYYYFLGLLKAGNINGVAAAGNDVVIREYVNGNTSHDLFWDASASGFPKVDAFEVLINK